jgi:hypothetical protein
MRKRKGTDKQSEVEDESLDYIMGVGSLHNVSDRPAKQKEKAQIGFIRYKTSTPKAKVPRKRNK